MPTEVKAIKVPALASAAISSIGKRPATTSAANGTGPGKPSKHLERNRFSRHGEQPVEPRQLVRVEHQVSRRSVFTNMPDAARPGDGLALDTDHEESAGFGTEVDMPEDEMPSDSKLTRSKQRWASEHKFLTGNAAPPAEERLPPGQHVVRDWPVLDLGRQPDVSPARWELQIGGMVERPLMLDWKAFMALPQTKARTDIHCVTTWSRYDNDWVGVATRDLLDAVVPRDEARFVMLHGYDGYTTNVPLADFAAEHAMVAHSWGGTPLTVAHGGPARVMIPHLYFWKSAKWIRRIDFLGADKPGFWEVNGYHMRGDPWAEERYS